MARYFVTGTDTGVGKTHVTATLAQRGRQMGRRVFAWKPIETGCEETIRGRQGADQEAISSDWQQGELRGVYRLLRPLAPLMAAEAEGESIDLQRIEQVFQAGSKDSALVLVEGAGGWRVPITSQVDMSGLSALLRLPVLIVARGTLGTINHTLLTIEAVRRDGQSVAAVVMSCRPGEDPAFVEQNAHAIADRSGVPVLRLWTDERILDPLLDRP